MAEDHIPESHEVVSTTDSAPRLHLDDLMNIKMRVTADLGRTNMTVKKIVGLRAGSIVTLDKMAGELTDIRVNGLTIARGEIVVISDILHVRMSEITGESINLGQADA